jgi:Na+-translocating ferredoxin:NAD+ oxidoreductase RnfC subunit
MGVCHPMACQTVQRPVQTYRHYRLRWLNLRRSYPGETFASSVFVAMTLTLTHSLSHVNQNVQQPARVARVAAA